eukprot:3787017-Rhodomonas_salina.2
MKKASAPLQRCMSLRALRQAPPREFSSQGANQASTKRGISFPVATVIGRRAVDSQYFRWKIDLAGEHHRRLSSSASESIFDVGEHDESIEILVQAGKDLLS